MSFSLHHDPMKGTGLCIVQMRKGRLQEAGEPVQDAGSSGSGLQSQACWIPEPFVLMVLP